MKKQFLRNKCEDEFQNLRMETNRDENILYSLNNSDSFLWLLIYTV